MKQARIIAGIAVALLIAASLVVAYFQPSPLEVAGSHCAEQGFHAENLPLLIRNGIKDRRQFSSTCVGRCDRRAQDPLADLTVPRIACTEDSGRIPSRPRPNPGVPVRRPRSRRGRGRDARISDTTSSPEDLAMTEAVRFY